LAAIVALGLAVAVALITNYALGTSFDDSWSVMLPSDDDAIIASSVSSSARGGSPPAPSGMFESYGGRDGATALRGRYFLPPSRSDGPLPPPPRVVMAHGLGAAQDCSLGGYVDTFVSGGMMVFCPTDCPDTTLPPRHT